MGGEKVPLSHVPTMAKVHDFTVEGGKIETLGLYSISCKVRHFTVRGELNSVFRLCVVPISQPFFRKLFL